MTDTSSPGSSQQTEWLTTSGGVRLRETDRSLKAGERGPTLLRDTREVGIARLLSP